MKSFLKDAPLPPEIKSEPPERFAKHSEEIARIYVQSLDILNERFRSL
jgi:hypothetical protein